MASCMELLRKASTVTGCNKLTYCASFLTYNRHVYRFEVAAHIQMLTWSLLRVVECQHAQPLLRGNTLRKILRKQTKKQRFLGRLGLLVTRYFPDAMHDKVYIIERAKIRPREFLSNIPFYMIARESAKLVFNETLFSLSEFTHGFVWRLQLLRY